MNPASHITPATERIAWVDALKIVACLLVVIAHCTDPFVGAFDSDRTAFVTGVAVGTLTRPSVPLFVMMTAILLLPSPEGLSLGQFYRRRIGRILPALIFWSLVLPVAFYLYFGHANPGSANPTVDTASYTWSGLWHKICLMTVNFNFDTVPLWYLYMLVGLYFIIPVISPWLHRASRRDVRLLLTIWGFTLLLPYIKLLAPAVGYTGISDPWRSSERATGMPTERSTTSAASSAICFLHIISAGGRCSGAERRRPRYACRCSSPAIASHSSDT